MSKNINIDVDKLTFWQAVKLHYATRNDQIVRVEVESSGLGWLALAIVFFALVLRESI